MIVWIKQENGNTIRLEDNWSHSIYVAADNKVDLKSLISAAKGKENDNEDISSLIKEYEFTSRYERITDIKESEVLKLTLSDSSRAITLARRIEEIGAKFGKLRVYNADLLSAQSYFYEHDLFSLAFCEATIQNSNKSKLDWKNKDSVWSTDYKVPEFKILHVKVNQEKTSAIPKYSDKIGSITITYRQGSKSFEIESESEADLINDFKREVAMIDPDFIFTEDGDSFTFPYLVYRAEQHGMYDSLILSRDPIPLRKPTREGTSYFSYGHVYFKPITAKLYGRIHLDKSNSFIWNESGLQGLYEIARICRMPLHTASRASIGKCLSSLQFYYATTKKRTLIPWKPVVAEHFKTLSELLVADRGGFIFEPETGVHEGVAEFDFESLYPNIMRKYNLSAETLGCNCCCSSSDYSKLTVPELGYHICHKRIGIVPTSLKLVLEKRARYKQLKNYKSMKPKLKEVYDARYSVLKWILVTSFGYLGFNNAKFGRIDAHIAVCAFDRKILLDTVKIAEQSGFRVLHGIVDSVWLQNMNKDRREPNEQREYMKLKELIELQTGFKVSFEGIYKWIVFVHSKINDNLPVPNRYFGVFENGSLKIRGMEARRHDTPHLFSECQNKILELMANGNTVREVKALMPKVKAIFYNYVHLLNQGRVSFGELVFTKRLSKNSNEYEQNRNTVENNSIQQLEQEGKSIKAGEILKYVITSDYHRKQSKRRAVPIELVNDKTTYNVRRYTELLAEVCNSVTEPFGYTFNLDLSLTN